jgi:hypothetical protein
MAARIIQVNIETPEWRRNLNRLTSHNDGRKAT